MRWLIASCLISAAAFASGSTPPLPPPPNAASGFGLPAQSTIRVLPVGDSITDGGGFWRRALKERLQAYGTAIDFVGPYSSGPFADNQHDGLWGRWIHDLAADLADVANKYSPHVIFVHLGTNDVRNDSPLATVQADLANLIAKAHQGDAASVVVITTLLNSPELMKKPESFAFNQTLATVVEPLGAWVFDWQTASALEPADFPDGLHPGETGQVKMGQAAAAWLQSHFYAPKSN